VGLALVRFLVVKLIYSDLIAMARMQFMPPQFLCVSSMWYPSLTLGNYGNVFSLFPLWFVDSFTNRGMLLSQVT
jgi:hypothetical protein